MAQLFRHRFLSAEEQFLTAFAIGPEAISQFDETWTSLSVDFIEARDRQQIDAQTLRVAHTVSSRIAILADHLLVLHLQVDELCATTKARCHNILSQIGMPSSPSIPPLSSATSAPSPLDSFATEWLLQHLHDPYPSSTVKTFMADRCQCLVKDVQDWFIAARRRIGWTALSQEKFQGSRRATCHAASIAYAEDDRHGDISFDLKRAFTAIERNALDFYGEYHGSPGDCFASEDYEGSSESIARESTFFRKSAQQSGERCSTSLAMVSPHDTYPPSPSPSHTTSTAATASACNEEEEDTTPPPPIAGAKRRHEVSAQPMYEGLEALSDPRPTKRLRCSAIRSDEGSMPQPAFDLGATSPVGLLNSPSTSQGVPAVDVSHHIRLPAAHSAPASQLNSINVNAEPAITFPVPFISSRKRRLSDVAQLTSPKRPRGLTAGPRRQTVSDPLPFDLNRNALEEFGIDNWFQTLGTPDMVEANNLDYSAFFDVELAGFDGATGGAAPSSCSAPVSPITQLDVSDADLASATAIGFDFSTSGFDFSTSDITSDEWLTSTSPSAGSLSGLSDYGFMSQAPFMNWDEYAKVLYSLSSSPASSQSSLSDYPTASQIASDNTLAPSSDDITQTLFSVDARFTPSNFPYDIGELSSLPISLETLL